ncbi:MAG: hypothetical protein ACT4QC_11505 [Planctomycetaceae bacterium]
MAEVTGRVLCEGQPVPQAMVFFEPLPQGRSALVGKQAFAFADDEGSFVLSTYGTKDGAVVGRHRVRVGLDPERNCTCVTDTRIDLMEVDVKADGPNSFELVLKKRSPRDRRKPLDN